MQNLANSTSLVTRPILPTEFECTGQGCMISTLNSLVGVKK